MNKGKERKYTHTHKQNRIEQSENIYHILYIYIYIYIYKRERNNIIT